MEILNQDNDHFHLEYGVAKGTSFGTLQSGGQVSGRRLSADGNLDLSCMFYCLAKGKLGYIIAQNAEEKAALKSQGYVNLHERLKETMT